MEESKIILEDAIRRHTDSMRRWYMFFAVVSIVMGALSLAAGVLLIVFGAALNAVSAHPVPVQAAGIVYILMAGVMVPAIVFLMRAAKAGKTSVALNNQADMVAFMRWSKHFWKYCGIVTIVLLGLAVLYTAAVVLFVLFR